MLCTLLQMYIKAMNEGSVASIADAWDAVKAVQSKAAFEEAAELFGSKFSSSLFEMPADPAAISPVAMGVMWRRSG